MDMRENKRAVTKLGLAAERCKHSLTTMNQAQCAVESLFDGCDFHYNMSRYICLYIYITICLGMNEWATGETGRIMFQHMTTPKPKDSINESVTFFLSSNNMFH